MFRLQRHSNNTATMPDQPWHVYLLTCSDGTFYCGITTDVARRVAEHNAGMASKYTRVRLPVRLRESVEVADKSAALKLELRVKKNPRARKLATLRAGWTD